MIALCFVVAMSTVCIADSVVVFNEIMYHPATNESELEWIEFHNQMAVDVDMSDWSVRGGIEYDFPEGTVIPGGGFVILAISPEVFEAQYGYTGAYGPFDGRLANSGEELILRNNSKRVMDIVDYDDDKDWPAACDGSGASLSKIDLNTASGPAKNWWASYQVGGTPGQVNFSGSTVHLAFSEIASAGTSPYAIEVVNMGQQAIDLTGYSIGLKGIVDDEYIIPSGMLDPSALLGFYPDFSTGIGDKLFLYSPDGQTVLDGVSIESNAKARRPSGAAFLALGTTVSTSSTSDTGTLITPTVADFSSENPVGLDRDADHTVDGSGLTGDGSAGSTHAQGETGMAWTTFGVYNTTDYNPYITYGLGGLYDVSTMRIWNYNSSFQDATLAAAGVNISIIGPDQVDVYTSLNGSSFDFADTVNFAIAPGADGYTGQDIAVNYPGVRYIKFDIKTNHDGAVFDGTGSNGGTVDGRSLTGLSEVRCEKASSIAFNPHPYDTETGVAVSKVLSWSAPTAFTPTGYDVYVDPNETKVTTGDPGCAYVSTNQPGTTFDPTGDLANDTTYYWRVKSLGDPYDRDGDIWNFTTRPGEVIMMIHGRWHYPDQLTIGSTNSFAFHDEIVINEIMYHPAPALEPALTVNTVTLVSSGAVSRTLIPSNGALGLSWTGRSEPFDDSSWIDRITGIGYETDVGGGPYQSLIETDVRTQMYGVNPGAYIRISFEVIDPELIQELMLKMKYDDGFIAYINGQEVKRDNFDPLSDPEWNSTSSTSNPDTSAVVYKYYDITAYTNVLHAGTNILAIHGLNRDPESTDFLILPELEAQIADTVETSPSTGQWIELFNRTGQSVDLSGWRLADAVEYEFPPGTTIEPGGYIVVAEDSTALQGQYPGVTILGDFGGNLSNSDERILLLDESRNIADEVHYYDGGRWPKYSDGYWASLELRNPFADNSKPEAWSASNHANESPWEAISYRGICMQNFGPTLWNELVFGMLDAGEILLDDISVVEDPEGSAIEVIQNGTFESGTAEKWRLIGNHRLSTVTEDLNDAGNHVLKLVSSGQMDYRHNHAETTFAGNRNIVDGKEYQISFRAKWIAGSNQLNVRLYYTRLAKTILLPTPELQGSPGSINTCYQSNMGPTFSEFGHSPAVPEPHQSVVVNARIDDPDGVNSCTLWWAVDGVSWNSQPMSQLGNGTYTGSIPGQPASTVVQFCVQAKDSLLASSMYPSRGPDSRALYTVQDGQASSSGTHNLRTIMTSADTDFMFVETNLMSNDRLRATVIYDEREVYYDVGVRLKGSVAARARDGDNYVSYSIRFDNDQPFRGVHRSVSFDRSGRAPVVRGQDEIYIKHMFNHAGVPSMYDDLVHFIAPRIIHTGPALLMMARYEDIFLESQWDDADDGTVYNLDITYHPVSTIDGDPESLKPPMPENSLGPDLVYLGNDKEAYRSPFQIKTNRRGDNYSGLIEFCRTMSLPQEQLEASISQVMDVDEWMRCTALANLCGIRDNYLTNSSWGVHHNIRLYCRPEDQKIVALPWDMDFVFDLPYNSPLWPQTGFSLQRVIELTGNKRLYYGHLKDLIETTFNTSYMNYWLASYSALLPGQDFTSRSPYIQARSSFVLSQLPLPTPFAVTDPNLVVDTDYATINGQAGIDVKEIYVEGIDEPLEPAWTSAGSGTNEVFYWHVNVPVDPGENILQFLAHDFRGNLIASDSITVTSTLIARPLRDYLRITELMYDPVGGSDYEFIELCNTGPDPLDLNDVIITDAITDFAFADGEVTTLGPNEYVVIVGDEKSFQSRYGSDINVAGEYSGNLANDGETLTIQARYNTQVLSFKYSDNRGWPLAADGSGHSLVPLVDAMDGQADGSLDYGGNWRASTYINGSPGAADPVPPITIVLNEIMAHTDLNDPAHPDHDSNDWIELYNPTSAPVTLAEGVWHLSDCKDQPAKWPIPHTVIPVGGWVSFDEVAGFHQNPLSTEGFGLDKAGEVALLSYLPGNDKDRVCDTVRFKGQENGVSLGRYPDGMQNWYKMSPSKDQANADPPLHAVISEIMYHPFADELEYIELYNPTSEAIPLWDVETGTGWRLDGGIEFYFAPGSSLPALGRIVVVGFEPVAENVTEFEDMYGPVPSPILGPYWRKLSNNGERVAIEKPQAPDIPGDSLSWVIVDEVIYSDQYPWPADADGQGRSLQRRAVTLCGRDPSAWSLAMPKPGASSADFNRDGNVDSKDLAIFGQAWLTLIDGQYWNPDCDISHPPDDLIDFFDFSIFGQEWLDGS